MCQLPEDCEKEVTGVSKNPVAKEISDFVKERIMSGDYREGDKISERVISNQFEVSRTVVREALMELKQNGWVKAEHKSGTYVAPLDMKRIEENYQARMALEPMTLMMAFPHLTEQDLSRMKENCVRMQCAATPAEYSRTENRHRCPGKGNLQGSAAGTVFCEANRCR